MLTMNSTPRNTHSKCLNIEERDSDVGYVVFTQQGKSKIVIDDSIFEINGNLTMQDGESSFHGLVAATFLAPLWPIYSWLLGN